MVQIKRLHESGAADPILTRISEEDKVPWYQKPNLRYLYFMLFPTCMGIELTSGFDSQMINALQIVPSWVEFGMYIVARMILGFGIPTCIVSGSSLIGELGYPKERPVLTSLFNVAYFVGQILAAGICFRTNGIDSDWAWRIPSLLQICPSLLQISFVMFLPESPRWLISKDRSEEANEILIKYHAEGDRDSEFVKAEMVQIKSVITLEMEASKQTWMDLLNTAGMRRRAFITAMLGLFTQWSGNTLISYYLGDLLQMVGLTQSLVKQQINLGLSGWSLVCAFLVAMLLMCYIAWTISMERAVHAQENNYDNQGASIATIFFIFMYSPCYNIGYNALTYTYLIELWPYALRSRGISLFQLFGRLANFFTTFVNPIGLANVSWRYLISYCCWLAFEVVFVYFMFPETAGRTLEELAFLFEDKALADQAVGAVEKVIHHEDMDTVHETKSGAAGRTEAVEDVGAKSKV
ncbi:hypothetical protein CSUB01_01216 [Colletotrichum sublineola]|uniref:Major facilitator superfamily (MFS) profile domain-containing protein n=1 Tax=Colletotrichum sublineola TaxID=1173701 RepID=A0A066XEW0_COLSU|nr:hypothetical protein CSUB01_01216 [Colletotrichum sublineola]